MLEEGNHRDITQVYVENGETEVYADIFLDCFNVFLSTNTNLSTLICSSCVSKLQQARDFKDLVLRTESQLMDALQNCNNDQMVLVNVPVARDTLDTTIGFQIQVRKPGMNTKQNKPIQRKAEASTTKAVIDNSSSSHVNYAVGNAMTNTKPIHKKYFVLERNPQKRALMVNTYQLLASSNCTLFRAKTCTGFPCFYCREIFEDFDNLKHHQDRQHTKTDLLRALKPFTAENLVVYVDTKELKCTLCNLPMSHLKELKSHLINIHQKKFFKGVTDRVVPFKVLASSYECQTCSSHYETFGAIVTHMNTHTRNYVCDVCGSGFVTMMRLKNHIYTRHREGTFLCEYCDKVFNTQSKLRVHVDFVHKMLKKIRCHKCPERFNDYFVQRKHMVDVHGEQAIVYRCNVCNKGFGRRYTLSLHMKRHLNQKDIHCDICPYMCYSNTQLKMHKLKHLSENRPDSDPLLMCSICDKKFSTKKSLNGHIQTHFVAKEYICNICGESFEQKMDLNNHKAEDHNDNSGE